MPVAFNAVYACSQCRHKKIKCCFSAGESSCEACRVHGIQCEVTARGSTDASSTNESMHECLFCRNRKIVCDGGPGPDDPNRTCNQCSSRQLKCEVPKRSGGFSPQRKGAGPITPALGNEEKRRNTHKENFDSEVVEFGLNPFEPLRPTVLQESMKRRSIRTLPLRVSLGSQTIMTTSSFNSQQQKRLAAGRSPITQVEESDEECLLVARPIFPVDVHYHLISQRDEILSVLVHLGQIDADKVTLSSGFDEDMKISQDIAVQCAYISCSSDILISTESVKTLLLVLGSCLVPFPGIIETPSQKFHCAFNPEAAGVASWPGSLSSECIDAPRDVDGNDGDEQTVRENSRNEGTDSTLERSPSDGDGDNPGNPDSDSGSEASDSSSTTVASETSGGGQSDGGHPSDPDSSESYVSGACAQFDITFNVKPSPSCPNNHSLRLKGTVEASKKLVPKSYTFPDTIATSRLQFTQLDFHPTSRISQGPKNITYNQFYARVDMETPDECPIYIHDVYPKSSQCIVDGKMKVGEAEEHASGRQLSGSAKIDIPVLLPFAPTISPSLSVSKTQTVKTGRLRECMQTVGRVQQVDTRRGLRWGYHVEDDWARQNGLRLTDTPSLCPGAEFDFLGIEVGLRCPEKMQITVRSYWSLTPFSDRTLGTSFSRGQIHFRNLGVQVTLDVPPHLRKTWAVHRDVDVWVGRDENGAMGGRVKDKYTYGDHGVTATPFFVLSDRECDEPDISEP